MKKIIIWILILTFALILIKGNVNSNSWFVDRMNLKSAEDRNEVIYILSDVISQIKKDDIKFWPFEVIRIIDWDTFEIDYFWEIERIRIYLIDTPERWEEWYEEAKEFAEDMLLYKDIYIKRIDKDRGSFWRLLREVYIDGINFWELLFKKGYAEIY